MIADAKAGKITEIETSDSKLNYTLSDGTKYYTYKEYGETTNELLKDVDPKIVSAIKVEVKDTSSTDIWINIALSIIPFVLIIGFLFFMMRGASGANNQAMSFGKSGAKLHDKEKEKQLSKMLQV